MTKRSDFVANKIVKKPPEGSSKEVQEKYEQKILKAKASYKVGEILVGSAILIGPLDLLAKAAIMSGITKSDDPADKMVVSKLKMLSDKASELKNKALKLINRNKGKQVTENEFKKPYEALQLQGMNIAKEIDATKEKISNTVTESSLFNKFGEYLSAGLPIAVAVCGEMEKLLNEYNCGDVYRTSDELIKLIEKYYSDGSLLKAHSSNAKALYNKMFNADFANEKLLNHIVKISQLKEEK